jgi:putative ABC transport system permease protein
MIGVIAIITLISIGTGVEKAVLSEFREIGYDVVLLAPRAGAAHNATLSISDLEDADTSEETQSARIAPKDALLNVEGVSGAGQVGTIIVPVSAGNVTGFVRVLAPSPEIVAEFSSLLGGLAVAEGAGPETLGAGEVVLGARTAQVFGASIGDVFAINGRPFRVVGILSPAKGNRGATTSAISQGGQIGGSDAAGSVAGAETFRWLANTDDALLIPLAQAEELWGSEALSALFAVRVAPGVSVSTTIAKINIALARIDVSMTPISTQALADGVQKALGMVKAVLASIAAIALLVGGVGMMNTMYTSVLERTREIGVLKSVGAKDRQVLVLFLMDSGLMGLLGGILGLALGTGLSFLGTRVVGGLLGIPAFSPVFSLGLIVGTVGFSFLLGAVAGAWPAWHAARLDPVVALAAE